MMVLNPLQFLPLEHGSVDRYERVQPCLSSWQRIILNLIGKKDCFEEENMGDDIIWEPSTAAT